MEDSRPAPSRGGVFDSILINVAFIFALFALVAPVHGLAFYFVDGILRIAFGTVRYSSL